MASLRDEIANILAVDKKFTAVLVGVGKIGQALAKHFSFSFSGVRLIAAFDIRPELIGSRIGGMTVQSAEEMTQTLEEYRPDIAILCVPRESANDTAVILVDHGVRGIWNFTNVELTRKAKDIVVENVHFTDSLLTLNYYLSESLKELPRHGKEA